MNVSTRAVTSLLLVYIRILLVYHCVLYYTDENQQGQFRELRRFRNAIDDQKYVKPRACPTAYGEHVSTCRVCRRIHQHECSQITDSLSDHYTCTCICSHEVTHALHKVSQEPRPGLVVSIAQVAAGVKIMFLIEQHLLAHVLLVDIRMPRDKGNLD